MMIEDLPQILVIAISEVRSEENKPDLELKSEKKDSASK